MPHESNRHILGLDLLRALAALLVMLFHWTYWNFVHDAVMKPLWPPAFQVFAPVSSAGWVGVEIFFVISGFVITFSSENMGAGRFAQHRLTRLLPSAFLCASITGLVMLSSGVSTFRLLAPQWLRSVSFWPKSPWIDGSYWTLPIEVSFYAIVFFCLLGGKRWLLPVISLLGLISTLWNLRPVPAHEANTVLLLRHGCLFAMGVFLFLGLRHGWRPMYVLPFAISCLGSAFEVGRHGQLSADILWVAGVAFLVLSVLANNSAHRLAGLRGAALLRRIGLTTYPFYLLHDRVGTLCIQRLHDNYAMSHIAALLLTLTLMLVVCAAIMEYAEPWLRHKMRQVLGWQSTRVAA